MSAAEKLGALDEAMAGRTKVRLHEQVEAGIDAKAKFVAALPQIRAVVEAMEENEKEASSPTMMSLRHLENIAARSHSALAALDEALS